MMKGKNKSKIVVCGTGFGQIYLKGIDFFKDDYELVGILARGSEVAKNCALKYGVPLITNINELKKEEIDIACVVIRSTVVGGEGTSIAKQLLSNGINVLQEQPIHYNDYIECIKTATRNRCLYSFNGFYSNLDISKEFIKVMRKIYRKSKINYIEASCSVHVLFSFIEFLGKVFNGFGNCSFEKVESKNYKSYFSEIRGEIKKIPISLKVINKISGIEPDNGIEFIFKISIGTDAGTLILTDVNGMVVWIPRMRIPHNKTNGMSIYDDDKMLKRPVSEIVYPYKERNYKELYETVWPKGIGNVLVDFNKEIFNNEKNSNMQRIQLQIETCKIWGTIGELLGTAENINGDMPSKTIDEY